MTAERHRQIEEIFNRAAAIGDAVARASLLQEACAGDPELLRCVQRLLKSYHAWSTNGSSTARPPAITCGPYVCEELLGSGGMGAVYRARRADGQFEQQVAIKFLRGSLRNDLYRARFTAERQILARMNHPNIARLLDGGSTDDGEPYLVMEFVDGWPLFEYCEDRRLTIDARLELFRQVLDAVDSAHRNLVVHRDLKPSNILVTREARVKLLDFGTSKLLEDDTTVTHALALTPAYAAPEQLRGEPVSTSADVFSLGAVLYKLLTGQVPFGEGKSHAGNLERALRDVSPPRPEAAVESTDLRRRLKGDLSSIILKALAYRPEDRYPSVAAFADDLERYFDGRPVTARKQNWPYLAAKTIRRHAAAFALTSVFIAGLAAAAMFSAYQAGVAKREAARAQATNRFLTEIFEIPTRDSASRHDLTVRELLGLAERRVVPTLGADPVVASDVDSVLANGFLWQGGYSEAGTLLERSLQHAIKAADAPRQAMAIAKLAYISYTRGRMDRAWEEAQQALNLWKERNRRFSPLQSATVLHDAGFVLLYIRPSDAAHRPYLEEALSLARRHPENVPAVIRAACMQKLAESYINVDRRFVEAEVLLREAVALNRADPGRASQLIASLQSLGRVNRFMGRPLEDELAQREAYTQSVTLSGAANPITISQHSIWAQSLLGVGRAEDGYRHAQAALADMRRIVPQRGGSLLWTNLSVAANATCLTKRFAECESLSRESLLALGSQASPTDLRFIDAQANLGLSLAGQSKFGEAVPLLEETLRRNESLRRSPIYMAALKEALRTAAGD